jgi:peroxiredoxin
MSISMKNFVYLFLLILSVSSCKLFGVEPKKEKERSNRISDEEYFKQHQERKIASYRGRPAPDFELELLDGKTQKLADLKGKIVLLNFWFAACKPCEVEIPSLNQLLADYGEKGVVVLAAGLDNEEKSKAFVEKKGMKFLVAPNAKDLANSYEVINYPTTFLIDAEGIIREVFIGASDFDATYTYSEIKPHLEKLLAKE